MPPYANDAPGRPSLITLTGTAPPPVTLPFENVTVSAEVAALTDSGQPIYPTGSRWMALTEPDGTYYVQLEQRTAQMVAYKLGVTLAALPDRMFVFTRP